MDPPRIALTMGDVAGIGPEVVARVCADPQLPDYGVPVVFGDPELLQRAIRLVGAHLHVIRTEDPGLAIHEPDSVLCVNPAGRMATDVAPGTVDACAGRAAYEFLIAAVDAAQEGRVAAICTAPLNKLALHRAGIPFPGHTEILSDRCGVSRFAMLLYLPPSDSVRGPFGLAVDHVTLHTSVASVPGLLSTESVCEKIELINSFLRRVGCSAPRISVCALNPHAGEEGLFGDEERRLIRPAVAACADRGLRVTGPFPADTLLHSAVAGDFDGVVAMYHDQGHIALKLLSFGTAVNVTLGLPIIRTSPSHGTAYDIAWQGRASVDGMFEAVRIASLLAQNREISRT